MILKFRFWSDLSGLDFARLKASSGIKQGVAVLLGLGLPTQAEGKSNQRERFAGTLTLTAETLIRVWMELGACVAGAGMKKLVLLNAHVGQVRIMDIVARDLRARHDMLTFSSNGYTMPFPPEFEGLSSPEENRVGSHAGDMDTSRVLAEVSRLRMSTVVDRPLYPL